jgi:TRAP-type C4-dicarboxylate transport system permease small subunit
VLKGLNRALDHLEEWLIAALIAAATALIFVSVLHRYGTGVSINLSKWAAARGVPFVPEILKDIYLRLAALDLSWAQELCIYMFIWMAKFGAAYGVRTGIHVGVDLLVNMVPARSRKQVILFSLLCGAFFTGIIATFGGSFVEEMFKTGQQSNDLEAPMWFIYLAIPVGSGLMCFRFLQVAWFYYWTGELPQHNEAHVEGIDANVPALHPASTGPAEVAKSKSSPLGLILILAPILILAVCLGEKAGIIVLPQAIRAATIFVLLIALMLTGIPVSIALGLTVLTFLFTLTEVPIEAVSMKLFTGIESFEIMAIILHPGRQLPDAWRRRAEDDRLRYLHHRALAWRIGARRNSGMRHVRPGLRIERRHRRRCRGDCTARDSEERLSDAIWCRHYHGCGLARHPDAAVHPEDHLCDLHEYIDWRTFRCRFAAWLAADGDAVSGDLVLSQEAKLSTNDESELA